MRLRLFRIGNEASKPSLMFDRFPVSLADPERWNRQLSAGAAEEVCLIEEFAGTLYAVSSGVGLQPLRNGRPFDSSPLLPGDRLSFDSVTYVVSYERMTTREPEPVPDFPGLIHRPHRGPVRPHFDAVLRRDDETELFEEFEDDISCSTERCACCSPAELVPACIP